VYEARGVVLLTGGLASPVAALAAELSIPTVLCPAARGLSTRDVRIDGTSGEVVQIR
jgi:phosphoenolpyruvate-protein kinase (PTS system EI component)